MIEDREKGGADPDKVGVDSADSGVEKGVVVKCCRKDANCGGPMIEDEDKGGADPGFDGANTDVDKGVGVKFC